MTFPPKRRPTGSLARVPAPRPTPRPSHCYRRPALRAAPLPPHPAQQLAHSWPVILSPHRILTQIPPPPPPLPRLLPSPPFTSLAKTQRRRRPVCKILPVVSFFNNNEEEKKKIYRAVANPPVVEQVFAPSDVDAPGTMSTSVCVNECVYVHARVCAYSRECP